MKYPFVTCKMVGEDGNAFACIARVRDAMVRSKVLSKAQVIEFTNSAMEGDYDELLVACMRTVNCDPSDDEKEVADELLENLREHLKMEGRSFYDPELDKELVHA